MIQTPGTSTRRRASSALRPEITTTCTFAVAAKSARICRVSFGTAAYSGRGAIGASVPSTSSSRTSGDPRSRASIAALSGSAGVASASGKRRLVLDSHDLSGSREDRVEPVENRGVVELPAHPPHAALALVRRHLQRRANRRDETINVEGVDQDLSLIHISEPTR